MRSRFLKLLVAVSILSGLTGACRPSARNAGSTVPGIEQTDSCRANHAHIYQVFIPAHRKSEKLLPLLVAIDPHGSGKTAIDHLKQAATTYPAVLVASNLIRNNDPDFLKELDELIADVRSRFAVDNHIYLTGFSGGARMVLAYAANHPVDGIIVSGAFADAEQLSAIKCPIMGLIGLDDFNFLETVPYILNPDRLPANAHVELTQASHEWPSAERLADIMGWLRLGDETDKMFDEQQVALYAKAQQARIDSLLRSGDLIQAACISRNMAAGGRFAKIASFGPELTRLTQTEAYRQQLTHLAESLRLELEMREKYGPALLAQNAAWWEKELSALHEKMNSEPDMMTKMAYRRVSGFIGIFCYMYSKQFADKRDVANLEHILKIYRLAEPDNPDMKHYMGVLKQLKKQ